MIPYVTLAPAGILIANDEQRIRIPLDKIISWEAPDDHERESYGYPGAKVLVVGLVAPLYVQDSVSSIDSSFNAG